MSDFKSMEEGFSEIIPNPLGIPVKGNEANQMRTEHAYWKSKAQQIKKEKSVKELSYWQVVSSCAAL